MSELKVTVECEFAHEATATVAREVLVYWNGQPEATLRLFAENGVRFEPRGDADVWQLRHAL
jgi:hypothetical protein